MCKFELEEPKFSKWTMEGRDYPIKRLNNEKIIHEMTEGVISYK